jgi:hypothetical protein
MRARRPSYVVSRFLPAVLSAVASAEAEALAKVGSRTVGYNKKPGDIRAGPLPINF